MAGRAEQHDAGSTIRFRCHYCYRIHELESGAEGRRGRCRCGKLMRVPASGGFGLRDSELPLALAVEESELAGFVPAEPGVRSSVESAPPAPVAISVSAPVPAVPPLPRNEPEVAPPVRGEPGASAPSDPPRSRRRGVALLLGALECAASLPAFVLCAAHALRDLLSARGFADLPKADHLGLPVELWCALLGGLGLSLLVDGVLRVRWARDERA